MATINYSAAPADQDVRCDRTKESARSPVPHAYEVTGAEYDSLSNGGSYDILTCQACGRIAYSSMAD